MYYLAESPGKTELLSAEYFYYVHQRRALGKKKQKKEKRVVFTLYSLLFKTKDLLKINHKAFKIG